MEAQLNGWDIIAYVLEANALTIWWLSGFWRRYKTDEWDWYSIFACGVPGVVFMIAVWLGNDINQFKGPGGPTHRSNLETGEIEEITLPDAAPGANPAQQGALPPPPDGIDASTWPDLWKYLTPEERKLFQ